MTKTFTPDDLLRYLYEDTTIKETQEIETALLLDTRLQEELDQLRSEMNLLEEWKPEPSKRCIDQIMEYARVMNLKALCN